MLSDLSFKVEKGEFVTIMGRSGCGKSTLLRLIAGLEPFDGGHINVASKLGAVESAAISNPENNGKDGRHRVGYMPQRDSLLPWKKIVDNAALPLLLQGMSKRHARAQVFPLLHTFGIGDAAYFYPSMISGGMRQRAAFLRTVLGGHDILLLDEPFGALDAQTRYELQDWILDLQRKNSWTILFVTHDVTEAVYLADKVVVLTPKPARVDCEIKVGLERPRTRAMLAEPMFGEVAAQIIDKITVTM